MKDFIKNNKAQVICFILTLALAVFNIGYAHKLTEREKDLEFAEESIYFSLSEISLLAEVIEQDMYYLDHIYTTAEEYGIPPEVVVAIMKVESNFNPDLVYGRCYGLMQIHDGHCEPWGIETEDLLDLKKNTTVGISLLAGLQAESDNLYQVLGKYNRGTGGYKKYVEEVGTEVTSYATKVYDIIDAWKDAAYGY